MRSLMKDEISIVKPDGQRIDGIQASVQAATVFIIANDLQEFPFEERDKIIRKLPNGCDEVYLVLDRCYYNGISRIDSHYEAKVRKETAVSIGGSSVIYNLNGAASRVNVNSVDSSTNVVNTAADDSFYELRALIEQSIDDNSKRLELLGHVDQMDNSKGSADYSNRYIAFIAAAADHITLIAPFIPFLTSLWK